MDGRNGTHTNLIYVSQLRIFYIRCNSIYYEFDNIFSYASQLKFLYCKYENQGLKTCLGIVNNIVEVSESVSVPDFQLTKSRYRSWYRIFS